MTLYSYTIPYDNGAAPNPYWGVLTLAICKPVIRRNAQIGDWVVGTGSSNSPLGDIQNSIVYVMKVSDKLTMLEYDRYCRKYLKLKIPDVKNKDLRRHVGDCIYDYSNGTTPILRESVHREGNIGTDLGGMNVLLSKNFFYFGDHPIFLLEKFKSIIKSNQGHKSKSNDGIADEFIGWIKSLGIKRNTLIGEPQKRIDLRKDKDEAIAISKQSCRIDARDESEYKKGIC